MHTLVVSPFLPYPPIFGGAIRLYHVMRMLASFSDVSLLSYNSWTDTDSAAHLSTICRDVIIDDSKPRFSALVQARSVFSPHSHQYLIHRSDALQRSLDELAAVEPFDVVLVEMTPMGQFRLPGGALHVLDLQNIEHELVERRAATSANAVRRATLRREAAKLRREELEICHRFDLLLATSDREAEILRSWGAPQVATLVNTIDADYFRPGEIPPRRTPPRLAFIGAMHVDANQDGLRWFMAEVFPILRHALPEIELDIVGGAPPRHIRALDGMRGVHVTNYVKDVRDYMARASVLVVPLRSGGGTRLKILEGLSFGVPTVSTTIGAEGLDLVSDEHILLADDPAAFARAVLRILEDPNLEQRLRGAGRRFVEERYDWRCQAAHLQHVLESSLDDRRRPSPSQA